MPRSPFRNVLIIKRAKILDSRAIIEEIEEKRKECGMTISDLCIAAGVSRTAYYRWVEGRGIMPETESALRAALKSAKRTKIDKKLK